MRVFLALAPDAAMRSALCHSSEALAMELAAGVRWIPACNYHLTMLAPVEAGPASLYKLVHRLKGAVHEFTPIRCVVSGVTGFPHAGKPRVVVACIEQNDELDQLQRTLGEYWPHGAQHTDFRPHISLARVDDRSRRRVAAALRRCQVPLLGHWLAKELTVYQSELLAGGAKYRGLATLKLGSANE